MAGPVWEEEGGPSQLRRAANLGHTVWAHDPNFSPPEPAASPSANWTVPIFWPLSAQWALVQLPAWLPAQDGHGRQQALRKGGVDKWSGSPSATWTPPLKPLQAPKLGTHTAAPRHSVHTQHRSLSFAPPGCPPETRSLPSPTLCPLKGQGIIRCFTHIL